MTADMERPAVDGPCEETEENGAETTLSVIEDDEPSRAAFWSAPTETPGHDIVTAQSLILRLLMDAADERAEVVTSFEEIARYTGQSPTSALLTVIGLANTGLLSWGPEPAGRRLLIRLTAPEEVTE